MKQKIIYTVVPYLSGFVFSYLLMSFVIWNRNPEGWAVWDRAFCLVVGWFVGTLLYVRFTWNKNETNV